jgi:hypothetical protein
MNDGSPKHSDNDGASMWAVCFLDLMGYRAELTATDPWPPPQDPKAVALLFKRVVSRRKALLNGPREYQDLLDAALDRRTSASDADSHRPVVSDIVSINATGFSDSIFLERSLSGSGPEGIMRVTNLVACVGMMMLTQLASRSPVRGGIDVGFGLLIDGLLHSAASVRAYNLERTARYPRFLLGERYQAYVKMMMQVKNPVEREWATRLSSFSYVDPEDGLLGLDYLGAPFRAKYLNNLAPIAVRALWDFARESYDRHKQDHARSSLSEDAKLADYYRRLMGYVQPRLEIWGVG